MSRSLSDAALLRIYSATRDLVRACGGIVRAGEVADVSKSEVSRWQSARDPDVISLSALMKLESECGLPLVTTVLAEAQGYRMSDPAHDGGEAASVMSRQSEVMHRASELLASGAAALADGRVTPAEAELWDRAAAGLIVPLSELRKSLSEIKAGAPDLKIVE